MSNFSTPSLPFADYLTQCRDRVNHALATHLGSRQSEFGNVAAHDWLQRVFDAMQYSLTIGGKRVRPTLVYAAASAISPSADDAALDGIACAVEFVHTYSLIHDDLPAMDDDDLRRGSPTCHKQFDEATAILAGDGLQTRAFELLANLSGLDADTRLALIATLGAASGARGMVGGQAIDLGAVHKQIALDHLETMHRLKTGALIRAAAKMGAIAASANAQQLDAIDRYAAAIGLAFQVQDDILDITADTATLGKQQGADLARDKPTYPALLGLDGARAKAQSLHDEALAALTIFGDSAEPLRQLSRYIIERQN